MIYVMCKDYMEWSRDVTKEKTKEIDIKNAMRDETDKKKKTKLNVSTLPEVEVLEHIFHNSLIHEIVSYH